VTPGRLGRSACPMEESCFLTAESLSTLTKKGRGTKMSIPEPYKKNFKTMQEAFQAGHLALVECQDKTTKRPVIAVCAVSFDGKMYNIVPFAKMFDGNPYDELNPPNPDGGFDEGEDAIPTKKG